MKNSKQKRFLILILTLWLFSLSLIKTIGSNHEQSANNTVSPIIFPVTEVKSAQKPLYTDYLPYGVYILGPSYVQRYPGQISYVDVIYTPIDNTGIVEGIKFSTYYVYINNTLIRNNTYTGSPIAVNLTGYIGSVGPSNITFRIWHTELQIWITKFTILNITNAVNVQEYLHLVKSTRGENNVLIYNVSSPNVGSFNWNVYVGGSWKKSGNPPGAFSVSIDDLGIRNFEGKYNISLVVSDNGYITTTTNNFTIEIVSPDTPSIENLNKLCPPAMVGEVQNLTFTCRVVDNVQIDRIEVFLPGRYLPIGVFKVIDSKMDNIKMNIPADFLMIYTNMTQRNMNINLKFIAIDKDGKSNVPQNLELYIETALFQVLQNNGKILNESLQTRPTIISTVVNDSLNPEYAFHMTFIIDRKVKCDVTLAVLSGTGYHNSFENHHNRIWTNITNNKQNDDQEVWTIFPKDNSNTYEFYQGVVFWVMFENSSSITSTKVKIQYPAIMEPDVELGDSPLRCLKFVTKCPNITTNDNNYYGDWGEWMVLPNENLRNVTTNTMEITLPGPGLYAFGKDAIEYQQNYNVPGYSIEIVIAVMGLTVIALIKRLKKA